MAPEVALLALLSFAPPEVADAVRVERGRLSVYWPGDGFNAGELACGGRFEATQEHVARRDWRRLGCGRRLVVCALATRRCARTTVRDAGPFGIYRGPLRNAVREGRWRVWTRRRPPPGWRFRAVVDLSRALWVRLGRPPALSEVVLYVLPRVGTEGVS